MLAEFFLLAHLFKLDENIFEKHYLKLEHLLYSGNLWFAFAPLKGFESECENIELGNVSIRRLSSTELEELWSIYK